MKLSKATSRYWVMALCCLSLSSLGLTGCQGGGGGAQPGVSAAAAKSVGAIDQEVLFKLPEFEKANKEVEAEAKKIQAQLEKELPTQGQPTKEQIQKIQEAQAKVEKLGNSKLDPLKTRMEAAILSVSRAKKLTVVLDKRIVVYGVPDITEDVKKAFQAPGDLKTGDEVDTTKSPIGYFDQDVVRSLKVFQQVEMDLYRKRSDMMKEFQGKAKSLSPAEQEMLKQEFTIKLDAYKEQLMTPLVQQVNDSVKEVAQAQGLSLVLDKQHVMQGGRNMTSEVVEVFLKKASGSPSKPVSTPAPAASATPGGQ